MQYARNEIELKPSALYQQFRTLVKLVWIAFSWCWFGSAKVSKVALEASAYFGLVRLPRKSQKKNIADFVITITIKLERFPNYDYT